MIFLTINLFASSDEVLVTMDEITEGSFLVESEEEKGKYKFLPQLDTKVELNIKGMVVNARVDQMFINNTDQPIEAVYVFPLPNKAAVNNMQMIIDDRVIQGIVKEKGEAKKEYNKAKKEGKRASITEQERPNIFTNSVANIMPGDTIIVRLEYVEALEYEDGKFSLRFPMVVAPRYIHGSQVTGYSGTGWSFDTDIVPDGSRITPPVVPKGMRTGHTILIDAYIDAGIEIDDISSTHLINKKKDGKNSYSITLKRDDYILNKDFVLEYSIKKGKEPKAALFVNSVVENNDDNQISSEDNYFMLMMVPPLDNDEKVNIGKEMIFVIDVSGSMSGTSINQAKESLLYSLDKLTPDDSFNIIAYSSNFSPLSKSPLNVNEENISKAKEFVNMLYAGGGTVAGPPLEFAMKMDSDVSKVKMIVFMTDGAIGNEHTIINLIDGNLGNARLFCVGIGSAPNSYLLDKVSEKGKGTFTYISDVKNVSEEMNELLNKIDMPVFTDIRLHLEGKHEVYPNPIPDLFINEPLIIYGKLDNRDDVEIKISGKNIDGQFDVKLPINFSTGIENNAIGDIWARNKIERLMDDYNFGGKSNNVKKEIINLSVKHQLVSKFTSFVAVEDKIVNPNAHPVLAVVPTDLPEGWDYDKVFSQKTTLAFTPKSNIDNATLNKSNNTNYANNKYPRTATSMPLYILLGIISIFVSSAIYFIDRKIRYDEN